LDPTNAPGVRPAPRAAPKSNTCRRNILEQAPRRVYKISRPGDEEASGKRHGCTLIDPDAVFSFIFFVRFGRRLKPAQLAADERVMETRHTCRVFSNAFKDAQLMLLL